jgi:hypothetical protein
MTRRQLIQWVAVALGGAQCGVIALCRPIDGLGEVRRFRPAIHQLAAGNLEIPAILGRHDEVTEYEFQAPWSALDQLIPGRRLEHWPGFVTEILMPDGRHCVAVPQPGKCKLFVYGGPKDLPRQVLATFQYRCGMAPF